MSIILYQDGNKYMNLEFFLAFLSLPLMWAPLWLLLLLSVLAHAQYPYNKAFAFGSKIVFWYGNAWGMFPDTSIKLVRAWPNREHNSDDRASSSGDL